MKTSVGRKVKIRNHFINYPWAMKHGNKKYTCENSQNIIRSWGKSLAFQTFEQTVLRKSARYR